MYFQDHSIYSYSAENELKNGVNIGWLSSKIPFNTGQTSIHFKNKLFDIIYLRQSNIMRGIHECDFCESKREIFIGRDDRNVLLGYGEIWIPSIDNDAIYVSPTLIYHYIKQHNYLPPDSYIESVLAFDLNS